jgi:acyl carrier protein
MTKSITFEEIRQTVAMALGVNPAGIDSLSSKNNISKWDSLGQLKIIMNLQQKFGYAPSDRDFKDLDSLAKIARALGVNE